MITMLALFEIYTKKVYDGMSAWDFLGMSEGDYQKVKQEYILWTSRCDAGLCLTGSLPTAMLKKIGDELSLVLEPERNVASFSDFVNMSKQLIHLIYKFDAIIQKHGHDDVKVWEC